MSNKTQLATNNTQLASLIQTLQGKAAGGGSAEMCTVTLAASMFAMPPMGTAYYTNENFATGQVNYDDMSLPITFAVPKGTFVVCDPWGGSNVFDECDTCSFQYRNIGIFH